MIQQINRSFSLTDAEQSHLDNIQIPNRVNEWERNTNLMKSIRNSILTQLDDIQNSKCCYCGLKLWETSRGEIEHIAPKASLIRAYPEFTFEVQNLALACQYCNGSSKKGQKNVVFRPNAIYSNCEFKIVHPYFDNPLLHYKFINNRTQIVMKPLTLKGRYSMLLFELYTVGQANARGKQRIHERKLNQLKRRQQLFDRFKLIIQFNRST